MLWGPCLYVTVAFNACAFAVAGMCCCVCVIFGGWSVTSLSRKERAQLMVEIWALLGLVSFVD